MMGSGGESTAPGPGPEGVPLDDRLARLDAILRRLHSVVVAFSAGVDSTFVLKAAVNSLGAARVLAVTGRSPSVAVTELEEAPSLANLIGVEHQFVDTGEFENENYRSNPVNRCYFCKTTLYAALERVRAERRLHSIINGINADDLGDYRPGLAAASEHGVRAPLAEAGLTKSDVRETSRRMGLPTFDKPAAPCLSSRVAYGERITPEKLRAIEAGEAFLHDLGIRECRVRCHERIARIEVPLEWLGRLTEPTAALRIDTHFRSLGFQYVTLDLRGFRSGSLNEVIAFGTVQPMPLSV